MTTPAKGSEDQRRTWKRWARSNGLTDASGRFIFTSISQRRSRFRIGLEERNILLLHFIEKTLIDAVHFRNSVVERWPKTIRMMLGGNEGPQAFESWVGPPGLEKESNRLASGPTSYNFSCSNTILTWSNDATSLRLRQSSYLSEMRFTLSENLDDDILNIVLSPSFGLENFTNCIHGFNPLLLGGLDE
jgi:hypothetical protein